MLCAGQGLQDNGQHHHVGGQPHLTFNTGALYTGTTYTIAASRRGHQRLSGNTLANTFTSTFTTGVNPATGNGSVQSIEPGNNATGDPTDTLADPFMNRQVNASTLPGQLTVTVNGAGLCRNRAGKR